MFTIHWGMEAEGKLPPFKLPRFIFINLFLWMYLPLDKIFNVLTRKVKQLQS